MKRRGSLRAASSITPSITNFSLVALVYCSICVDMLMRLCVCVCSQSANTQNGPGCSPQFLPSSIPLPLHHLEERCKLGWNLIKSG